MNFVGIIPARYSSTRFPGKPLAILGGKPEFNMFTKKFQKCLTTYTSPLTTKGLRMRWKSFGGNAIMTSPNHKSGTDRIEEAVNIIEKKFDVIINIQGDEPFIHKTQIETICRCFR